MGNACKFLLRHGLDVVLITHDKDASGTIEVRRAKGEHMDAEPDTGFRRCVCEGRNFFAKKSGLRKAEKELKDPSTGKYVRYCQGTPICNHKAGSYECDKPCPAYCGGVEQQHCIRHGKVNLRKAMMSQLDAAYRKNKKRLKGLAEAVKYDSKQKISEAANYVAKVWGDSIEKSDETLEVALTKLASASRHLRGDHTDQGPYSVCKDKSCYTDPENYKQTFVFQDNVAKEALENVERVWFDQSVVAGYVDAQTTNACEAINFVFLMFFPKMRYSHDTTAYKCASMCTLLYANEGGWVFV